MQWWETNCKLKQWKMEETTMMVRTAAQNGGRQNIERNIWSENRKDEQSG